MVLVCFFFKQKTAYEMRISDWSSDVCSSDLGPAAQAPRLDGQGGFTMKNTITLLVLVVLLALLIALPWIAPYFYIFIATEILILGLFEASFNLIFGYTGMLSFGHAAFFGVGAYAQALLLQGMQWPLLACLLVAIVA